MAISFYKKTQLHAAAILTGLVVTASASAAMALKQPTPVAAPSSDVASLGRFEVTPAGARFVEAGGREVVLLKK